VSEVLHQEQYVPVPGHYVKQEDHHKQTRDENQYKASIHCSLLSLCGRAAMMGRYDSCGQVTGYNEYVG
jgi:hypothetical protein